MFSSEFSNILGEINNNVEVVVEDDRNATQDFTTRPFSFNTLPMFSRSQPRSSTPPISPITTVTSLGTTVLVTATIPSTTVKSTTMTSRSTQTASTTSSGTKISTFQTTSPRPIATTAPVLSTARVPLLFLSNTVTIRRTVTPAVTQRSSVQATQEVTLESANDGFDFRNVSNPIVANGTFESVQSVSRWSWPLLGAVVGISTVRKITIPSPPPHFDCQTIAFVPLFLAFRMILDLEHPC